MRIGRWYCRGRLERSDALGGEWRTDIDGGFGGAQKLLKPLHGMAAVEGFAKTKQDLSLKRKS